MHNWNSSSETGFALPIVRVLEVAMAKPIATNVKLTGKA